jgi:predicted permease
MRLFLGLILWVGTPCYFLGTIANGTFDPMVGGIAALLAVGMAFGEYTRYSQRERRRAAERAQQDYWRGKPK